MRRLCLVVVVLLLVGCRGLAPGNVERKTVTREVVVFADVDGDGVYDESEVGLADVLVVSLHNQHGQEDRLVGRSDGDGQAVVSATYTHYFWVSVVPPCGYRATTPITQDATGAGALWFGFVPDWPVEGEAVVRLDMWEDVDGDGVRGAGDLPVVGAVMVVSPLVDDGSQARRLQIDAAVDDLAVTTDGDGQAVVSLGNSCGILRVAVPVGVDIWETVVTVPEAVGGEAGGLAFGYGVGETVIEWGLRAGSSGSGDGQ